MLYSLRIYGPVFLQERKEWGIKLILTPSIPITDVVCMLTQRVTNLPHP
jgi:hypothetical protein